MVNQLFRIVVTLGALALIVLQIDDVDRLGNSLLGIGLPAVLLVISIHVLGRTLMAYKWIRLLRCRGMPPLGLWHGVQIYCASMVWGLFLPSTMGADAIRIVCTTRAGLPPNEVITSVLVERIAGVIVTPSVALGALLALWFVGSFDARLNEVLWVAIGALAVALCGLLALTWGGLLKKLRARLPTVWRENALVNKLAELYASLLAYREHRGELLLFFGLTVLEQFLAIAVFWALAWGMQLPVDPLILACATMLAFLAGRIPISIGGLVVFEGVFILVLGLDGIPAEPALALALLARVLETACWLPFWMAYMLGRGSSSPPEVVANTRLT